MAAAGLGGLLGQYGLDTSKAAAFFSEVLEH